MILGGDRTKASIAVDQTLSVEKGVGLSKTGMCIPLLSGKGTHTPGVYPSLTQTLIKDT